ncbi:DUF1496 domain-containing protein [Salinisphaera japonica]|uniref:Uncharacterized protein n=1 Tax=Salinisphaera japonica YTM-1 TaxID=1209778 RepID=A0A423PE43_9GAMM|nr:DUF1496 domain-containing protein [Salinisphaera japonica]ROO23857.1 hypothetical protein SAJA_15050 [Salinisphaera japonica YTM-1]
MRRSQGFVAAGVVAVAALVAVPVWAQSGGSGDNESSMNQSPTQSKQQAGQQQQQQQPRSSMPQQAANGNDKPMDHKKSMGPHHGPGRHAPPPPDGPMAAGNPLRHVCLSKDQAYSPGAVVTMNQKPYACQAMADDTSGTLHWVAVKEDE